MIEFKEVELVITTKCTLKCKDCAHLIPYYPMLNKQPEHLSKEEIFKVLKKFFSVVEKVNTFRLLGGEPLLSKDIADILEKVKRYNICETIEIVTNGTVLPRKGDIEKYAADNVYFRISNYGNYSTKVNQLIEMLEKNHINYRVHDCMKNKWGDLGEPEKREISLQELEIQYKSCTAKDIYLIYEGRFYVCGRAAHSAKLGLSPDEFTEIDILDSSTEDLKKKFLQVKNTRRAAACEYCYGRQTGTDYRQIEPALQLTDEDIERLRTKYRHIF